MVRATLWSCVEARRTRFRPGGETIYNWKVDPTDGAPIAAVGIEVSSDAGASGVVYLDYLTWEGTPEVSLIKPSSGGTMWKRAWIDAVDSAITNRADVAAYRIMQNHDTGLFIQGNPRVGKLFLFLYSQSASCQGGWNRCVCSRASSDTTRSCFAMTGRYG